MEFSEVVVRRRSVRSYLKGSVPSHVIESAIDMALEAPNSSNMQCWRIFWVASSVEKTKLVEACLGQSAAKTASDLVVFVADPSVWKTTQTLILDSLDPDAPAQVKQYYGTLMPILYGWRWLAPLKWLVFNTIGIFRPTPRGPWSSADIQEVCVKSTALAAENFMLSIVDQGFDTCPMEGFDESRVRGILGLPRRAKVVMVVAVGKRDESVALFKRVRLPREIVVKKI